MNFSEGIKKSVFLFLAAPAFSYAGSADLCTDLASFSCAPGEYNDGTGSAETMMFKGDMISPELKIEVSQKLAAGFSNLVAVPENSYFRSSAISALSLAAAPDCQSKDRAAVARCNKAIVSGLTTIAGKNLIAEPATTITTSTSPSNPQVIDNLKELSTLMLNGQFVEVVSSVSKAFDKKMVEPEVEKKIRERMFPKLKTLLAERIKSLPIEETKKQFMIAKIQGLTFAGTDCEEMTKGLSRHLIPNAFYDPEKNSLKVCQGLLHGDISEFHVAAVVVHELAHSVDPCCLAKGIGENIIKHRDTTNLAVMDSEYVLPHLISCLRSPLSLNAKNQVLPFMPVPGATGGQFGYYNSSGALDHCKDQIGEATSDWFAAEVLPEYIQQTHPNLTSEQWRIGASNIFRPMCSFADGGIGDRHAATFTRINAVFLQNPKLRRKMKCTEDDPARNYCDGTEATAVAAPANPFSSSNPNGPVMIPPSRPSNPMPQGTPPTRVDR